MVDIKFTVQTKALLKVKGVLLNDAPDKREKPEYLKQTGTVRSNPGLTVTL